MNRVHSLSPALLTILLGSSPAPAHDSWLVASKNVAAPNESVRVAFVTSEVFPIGESAAKTDRVAEWVVAHADQARKVEGYAVEKEDLAATVKFEQPGIHVVGIALLASFIELPAKEFVQYLEDEKATSALASYRRGPGDQAGHELYTKFAKTFVEVPGGGPAKFTQRLGHKLEIIPLSNPCAWKVGDNVKVRVLRDGHPVPNLRISSGHEGLDKHAYVEHTTTDIDGAARLTLSRPGLWFFRTHSIQGLQQQPAYAPPSAPRADWESFWASMTFRVLEKAP